MGSKCILQCAIYRELKLGSAGDNVRTKEKRRQEVRHDPEWPPGIRTGEYMQRGEGFEGGCRTRSGGRNESSV